MKVVLALALGFIIFVVIPSYISKWRERRKMKNETPWIH